VLRKGFARVMTASDIVAALRQGSKSHPADADVTRKLS
jgi:hypothetical protein